MNDGSVLEQIGRAVGGSGLLTGNDCRPYLAERRGRESGRALAVARPANTREVAEVVRICRDAAVSVVPLGGNTGLVGGGLSGEGQLVISLERLNRIRDLDPPNYTLTAEAGCILAELQQAARAQDRLFPLSLAAEGSCRIGGNLATNAGGVNVLRYGNARDLTLGLEVVLPSGEIWDGLRGLRKDNTGYDLKDLFIGSEGTLGIITAAVLKLFPLPADSATALIALSELSHCVELLDRARRDSGDCVTSFELISRPCLDIVLGFSADCRDPLPGRHLWYVLLAFTSSAAGNAMGETMERCLGSALDDGLISDAVIAGSESQAREFWRLREGISDAQRSVGTGIRHDVSVRVSDVPRFITEATRRVDQRVPGLRVFAFGHVGDGNVHFNLFQPRGASDAGFVARGPELTDTVYATVRELGGSFSAEHGVGLRRRDAMRAYKPAVELNLMGAIKSALDPGNLMNPGKVLPD